MKNVYLSILFLIISISGFSQNYKKAEEILKKRKEVYIKFDASNTLDLKKTGRIMSIDKIHPKGNSYEIIAYFNSEQFQQFRTKNLDFELLTPPSMLKASKMCTDQGSVKNWNCYPTYSQYVAFMESFQTDYPDLCQLVEFGQSIEGRKLFALKISDNVASKEAEPEFFYTSTMHGDETTGYALMLRLIDYLLTNYGIDSRVTDLVDNTEIWINPLSNPDGTYDYSDNDISYATRSNSNGIDLNRNFPDIEDPDGNPGQGSSFQTENIAMMNFMKSHNFVLSANFHGGAEVVNYPWDTWHPAYPDYKVHADDLWYQEISSEYADTAHANSSNYMDWLDLNPNPSGITNGAAWYVISGGRQDYVNYYLHGKEVTIEISTAKIPDASSLSNYWNYNYRSFLNYINNVHKGIYGKVTDQDGNPLRAKISLTGYDTDSSEVYSDAETGMYYRMLCAGDYQLVASLNGYAPAEFNLNVLAGGKTEQNIVLQKYATGFEDVNNSMVKIIKYNNPIINNLVVDFEITKSLPYEFALFDIHGKKVIQNKYHGIEGLNKIKVGVSKIESGTYICKIYSKLFQIEFKIIKLKH